MRFATHLTHVSERHVDGTFLRRGAFWQAPENTPEIIDALKTGGYMVLPIGIEPMTSPLPREWLETKTSLITTDYSKLEHVSPHDHFLVEGNLNG